MTGWPFSKKVDRTTALPSKKKYRNDFCPYLVNKWITIDGIIGLLKLGFPMHQLPLDIQQDVRQEMSWRRLQERYR